MDRDSDLPAGLPDSETIAAVSVAVRHGDRLLLVRRGRAPSRGLYAFPGGRVEPGESDEEAAAREVLEETALVVSDLEEFQTVVIGGTSGDAPTRYRLKVFIAHAYRGEPVAGDDAEAVGWFGITDVDSLPMAQSMADAIREILGQLR